jgi:hypothetical protein
MRGVFSTNLLSLFCLVSNVFGIVLELDDPLASVGTSPWL